MEQGHIAAWSVLRHTTRLNSAREPGGSRPLRGTRIFGVEVQLASEPLFSYGRPTGEGILPSQEIVDFVRNGIISSPQEIADDQIQPASIDLRLSNDAYRVRASFLPGRSTTLLNKATSDGMLINSTLDISSPTLLEPNVIYVIELMETLNLPSGVFGIANPKSTTGRLDIFTRLITEHGDEFERVKMSYRGKLYIEVVSQTFPIIVQAGMRLNQLRFVRGKFLPASDARLRQLDQDALLVDPEDDATGAGLIDRGLRMTVDLQGNGSEVVGYKAKKFSPPIDLSKVGYYDIAEFWTPIQRNEKLQHILEPDEFYILASKQRVRVPPDLAAEMLPYDLATQEFRVHYAGFFDPGFGYGKCGEIPATKIVLEVRASRMPILLEDNQFVGRVNYFKMSAAPEKLYGVTIGSSYQQQGLSVSKQFKREGQFSSGSAAAEGEAAQTQGVDSGRSPRHSAGRPGEVDEDDAPPLKLAFPSGGFEGEVQAMKSQE
jgi:dCTP deaminase